MAILITMMCNYKFFVKPAARKVWIGTGVVLGAWSGGSRSESVFNDCNLKAFNPFFIVNSALYLLDAL
jgi:hypothetical protein